MKGKKKQMWRSIIALVLTFTLVFGTASTSFATMNSVAAPNGSGTEDKEPIKYVSIGDSMTNGYGFYGYNQDLHLGTRTSKHMPMEYYNYFGGTGVYGSGSYALQFEKYLAEKLGNEVDYRGHQTLGDASSYSNGLNDGVDHIQMATSAFRTEELATYLGIVENQFDNSVLPLKDGYLDNSWNYVFMDCNGSHRWGLDEYRDPLGGSACCGDHGYLEWFVANPGRVVTDPETGELGPAGLSVSSSPNSYTTMFRYLSNYYQNNVESADIISLHLGNAAFDAYFMDRLFKIWGALGETFNKNNIVFQNLITLAEIKDQLCENDAERAFVDNVYEAMCSIMADQLGDNYGAMKMDQVCELLTYITFSYMYNYKQIIEKIGEINPDAKIMVVGMLNSYSGLYLDGVGDERLDLGELMGTMYEFMNSYVAGMCANYMENTEEFEGTIYYVDQPEDPEMIASKIGELAASGWGTLDNGRLDGTIVRYKTITAYNGTLYEAFELAGIAGTDNTNHAIGDCNAEITVAVEQALAQNPDMTIAQMLDILKQKDPSTDWQRRWIGGSLAYLGCEAAMIKSLETPVIDVESLVTFANTESMVNILKDAPKPFDTSAKMADVITEYQTFFETNMMGVIRFFAFNKMGNGIAAHPTPSNHDRLAKNMIAAYEDGYTVQDKCTDDSEMILVNEIYYALSEEGLLTIEQTNAIIDYFTDVMLGEKSSDGAVDYIYDIMMRDTDAKQKIQIIDIIYNTINEAGYLDDVDQAKDIKEIFDIVAAESPEAAVEVFEILFFGIMESDELTEEKAAAIIDDVYTVVMKSDKLSAETKMTIVEKVTALVGAGATDLPEKPEVVVNALRVELTASGYFTDEQIVEIINIVYDLVTSDSEDERADQAEKLHDNLLGRDDLSDEEKAEIITIIYNVLDQYGYVDYAANEAVYLIYEYYDEAYEYAYNYALEEGYIDATIDGIKEVEKALKVALDEAKATGMSDELKAELEAAYNGALETTAQLEKLILEADKLDDATYDEAMALVATLEVNLNDFCSVMEQAGLDAGEQLWIAYETLKPIVIEQLKIAVEKGMEWLINEVLPGVDKAMYDWLYENPETVINFFIKYNEEIDAITDEYGDEAVAVLLYVLYTYGPEAVEYAIENPEEAIAKWVEWYNKHGHKVWPMIDEYIKTLDEMGAFDELKAAAAELEAYVIAYAEKVVAELEAMIAELDEAAKAALEELKAAIEAMDVEGILAALEEIYTNATTGYYAATEDSYYVALGDTDVEYAQIVADELDLDKDQFVNAGVDGMRAEDLRMILDADYEADAYGQAFGDVADLREELTAEIEKADLITLGFNNNTITKFTAEQIAAMMSGEEAVAMDWARYIGEDGAAAMDNAVAAIEEALVAEGMDAETIDMVVTAVESYAYACTGFACNYPEAINEIKAINPDAQVVVVGMYNPFENAVVEVEGTQIPVGEFIGALVDLANVHYTSYAILTGNAVYVHAPAVETQAPFEAAMGIDEFITAIADLDALEPSAAGHEYIAEQIIDAMNVVSKAVYDAQKLIDQIKAFGEVTRDNLADARALADAARAAWDKLTDAEKELIGLDNYKVLVDFELAVAKVELGVAEDIAAAEKALAEAEAKAAEIERALKITDSTVTNLKAKVVNKSQIKVTWTADETTPDQYRVTLLRAGKKVGTYWVAGDKETVTLKNLLRGTNFTVRVTPVAKVDGQKYFSIYKTSNKVKTQLQKANLTVKKAGAKKQIISKDQNSTGFQIYISQDKNFKKNVKKLAYQTNKKGLNVKVKAKNFKKGTNYVKVRSYTKVNGKKVYGAWSGTVKVVK